MATPAEWAAIHQQMVANEVTAQQHDREVREDCTQALLALAAYYEDENPHSLDSQLAVLLREIGRRVSRIRCSGFSFVNPPMPLTDQVIREWFGQEPPRGGYRY